MRALSRRGRRYVQALIRKAPRHAGPQTQSANPLMSRTVPR